MKKSPSLKILLSMEVGILMIEINLPRNNFAHMERVKEVFSFIQRKDY